MGTRVRQSSSGIRLATLFVQFVFVAAIFIGLVWPPADQSVADQNFSPYMWIAIACIVVLAARTLTIGVYLTPTEIIIRSWLRTYRISLAAAACFGTEPWSDWLLTRSSEQPGVRMLTIEGTHLRAFSATAVRRSRAIAQSHLLNAYIAASGQGSSDKLVYDFARGSSWRTHVRTSLAQQAAQRDRPARHAAEH